MEILVPITWRLRELLVRPVGRQFDYLIHYKKKIENLKHQLHKLEDQKNGVQQSIVAAIRNGAVIRADVSEWIKSVDVYVEKAEVLLGDGINEKKRCFNLATLYHLGKEAKEITMIVIELQEDGRMFTKLSNPAPPLGIESMSSRDFVTYETTKLVMMKVWEALTDKKINLIGIHGMGGVGKTTMVTEIGKRAKDDKLFDEVLMVVVSQTAELKNIQDQLADKLGLKLDEKSESGRADRLHVRLQGVKRILIILDDVWRGFDVEKLGIEVGDNHRDCKIVITTRIEQVCSDMRLGMGTLTTKTVKLECLSEQDSWNLFNRKACVADDSPTLKLAKEVCEKCHGSPLALVTVGEAMKGKAPEKWIEALKMLDPTSVEGVEEKVFSSVKLSYDLLDNDEARSWFLLCSMFPEDFDIPIESLVRYGVGLYTFKKINTIQDARGTADSVINHLKASSLLLASEREGHVKMHDIVRTAAINIGSDKYYIRDGGEFRGWPIMESYSEFRGISLMGGDSSELPPAKFPNLQILLLEGYSISFFEGMESLRVLDLRGRRTKFSFSPNMCINLSCLRTLILENMEISNTAFLGLIKTLEVISLKYSHLYDMAIETWELTNLRLLDLEGCTIRDVPGAIDVPNVIKHMSQVEELYLLHTRIEPGAIAALNSLQHLTVLTISIDNVQIIPADFVFPDLEKFSICIDFVVHGFYSQLFIDRSSRVQYATLNTLTLKGLNGPRGVRWIGWVKMLLKRTQSIIFWSVDGMKNIVPTLSQNYGDGLNSLKNLVVAECSELEYLIDTEAGGASSSSHDLQVLSELENLHFRSLSTLKGLYNVAALPSISGGFLSKLKWLEVEYCDQLSNICNLSSRIMHLPNLRVLRISKCDRLRSIFQPSVARSLQQLQRLDVSRCEVMEEIVVNEDDEEEETIGDSKIVFNSLKTLILEYLPNLDGFCTGSVIFEWPSLEYLLVSECPKMKTFAATSCASGLQSPSKLKSVRLAGVERMPEAVDLNTIIGKVMIPTSHSIEEELRVDRQGFNDLKDSYNKLGNEEAKSCFLLCSMFSKDSDISIESLVWCGVGLDTFGKVDTDHTVRDAREKANSVINNLKKVHSLLLDSQIERHVKMHDVVRMDAIHIESNKYYIRTDGTFKGWPIPTESNTYYTRADSEFKDWPIMESYAYTGVSLMGGHSRELPRGKFPNLEILLLDGYVIVEQDIDNSFFEGMKALKVFYWRNHRLDQLPIFRNLNSNLQCLRTLILENVRISNTAFRGLTKTLEILSLKHCDLYDIPAKRWHLTNLRLLSLESCMPRTLPNCVIKRLPRIEELYVIHNYVKPEVIPKLNSLNRLKVMTISVRGVKIKQEDFVFPELEKFSISIVCDFNSEFIIHRISRVEYATLNTLTLKGLERTRVRWLGWVKMLLKRTESIDFWCVDGMKNIVPDLSSIGDGLNSLKNLVVFECRRLEYLIDTEAGDASDIQVLSELESIQFQYLSSLKGLCKVPALPISGGFLSKLKWLEVQYCDQLSNIFNLSSRLLQLHNLRVVGICRCDRLRCIFQPSVARSLKQLEKLEVSWCEDMEEIVSKDNEEEKETVVDSTIVLNSLNTLRLRYLPKLSGFCKGSFIFKCPSLKTVVVVKCPKMKTFAATSSTSSSTSGLQSTPKLKSVTLDGDYRMLEGADLNTLIGNHSKGKEKEYNF